MKHSPLKKEFRALSDDEKLANFGPLLKFYQEEIDRLTSRSKFAENSFLGLYKLLAEAPDPLIGLTASVVSFFKILAPFINFF